MLLPAILDVTAREGRERGVEGRERVGGRGGEGERPEGEEGERVQWVASGGNEGTALLMVVRS